MAAPDAATAAPRLWTWPRGDGARTLDTMRHRGDDWRLFFAAGRHGYAAEFGHSKRSQRFMRIKLLAILSLLVPALALSAAGPDSADKPTDSARGGGKPENFQPEEIRTRGSVVVDGRKI